MVFEIRKGGTVEEDVLSRASLERFRFLELKAEHVTGFLNCSHYSGSQLLPPGTQGSLGNVEENWYGVPCPECWEFDNLALSMNDTKDEPDDEEVVRVPEPIEVGSTSDFGSEGINNNETDD